MIQPKGFMHIVQPIGKHLKERGQCRIVLIVTLKSKILGSVSLGVETMKRHAIMTFLLCLLAIGGQAVENG